VIVKRLGLVEYAPALEAMRVFTAARGADTSDEIWLLQHPPVYTLGQAGKPEHLLQNPANIPLVRIDRGGQITYHGPGQLVAYLLLDLPRRRLKVRELVHLMEQAIIDTLADYGLAAQRKDGAPGVYIAGDKIAALGLRVRNGCSYHGLAINVDADLAPFGWINPWSYEGLKTIRMKDFGIDASVDAVGERLLGHLQAPGLRRAPADAVDQPPYGADDEAGNQEDRQRNAQSGQRIGDRQRKADDQAVQGLVELLAPRPRIGEARQHEAGPLVAQQRDQQPAADIDRALQVGEQRVRLDDARTADLQGGRLTLGDGEEAGGNPAANARDDEQDQRENRRRCRRERRRAQEQAEVARLAGFGDHLLEGGGGRVGGGLLRQPGQRIRIAGGDNEGQALAQHHQLPLRIAAYGNGEIAAAAQFRIERGACARGAHRRRIAEENGPEGHHPAVEQHQIGRLRIDRRHRGRRWRHRKRSGSATGEKKGQEDSGSATHRSISGMTKACAGVMSA